MIIRCPYGDGAVPLDLRGFRVRALRPEGPRGHADPAGLVLEALERPLAGPGLETLARKAGRITVVVPDGTRSAEIPAVLPVLSDRLERWGLPPARQTVVIACGTHPPVAAETVPTLVGTLNRDVTVVQHDSRDAGSLVAVGEVGGPGPIRLNRAVVKTDLLVTIGAVRHHYFAGFGGGPKMTFPGVAGYEEIQANHARVFDLDRGERVAACDPGRLNGNPVAEEIARAADLHPPDLAVCLVPGVDRGLAAAFAGPWRQAWHRAIEGVRSSFEVEAGNFDFVVASGGGAPSDETLIQAHKGLDAACRFARPGAEVLFLASMAAGPGARAMQPFLDDPRPEAVLDRLKERWIQYGHTTLRIVEKTARFRVHLVTDAAWEGLDGLGFVRVPSADEVVDRWRETVPGAVVGVIPGPVVFPRRKSSDLS